MPKNDQASPKRAVRKVALKRKAAAPKKSTARAKGGRSTAKRARSTGAGRIRAKGNRAGYARRVDDRIASEINRLVDEGAKIRQQIEAKIERRIREETGTRTEKRAKK